MNVEWTFVTKLLAIVQTFHHSTINNMLSDCYFPVVSKKAAEKNIIKKSDDVKIFAGVVQNSQTNAVSGSAYIEIGGSKVICSVFGPRLGVMSNGLSCNLETGTFECEVHFANFLADNAINGLVRDNQTSVEQRLSEAMKDALESSILLQKYPKALISVHALILQSSYYDAVALINSGSLALADASIELKDFVSACSISCEVPDSSNNGTSNVVLNIGTMSSLDLTTYLEFDGRCKPDILMQLTQSAKNSCVTLRNIMINAMKQKLVAAAKQ